MTARAALVVAAVATTTCALAVPALAYPPGTDPVVQTSAGGYTVGTAIPVSVSNLAPGCEVQFTVSLNGQTLTSLGSTTNRKGTANTTIPAPKDAGAYTVTAHGVPSTTNPDCATGDVSTIVVVSSNGANSGSSSTTSPGANNGGATNADTGILGSITGALTGAVDYLGQNPRVRNLILIVVVAAAGFWFFLAYRRRTAVAKSPVEILGSGDGPKPPAHT